MKFIDSMRIEDAELKKKNRCLLEVFGAFYVSLIDVKKGRKLLCSRAEMTRS